MITSNSIFAWLIATLALAICTSLKPYRNITFTSEVATKYSSLSAINECFFDDHFVKNITTKTHQINQLPPCDPVNTGTFSCTFTPANQTDLDYATEGYITNSGEKIILGFKEDNGTSTYNLILLRLDANGNTLAAPMTLEFSDNGPFFIDPSTDIHRLKFVETHNSQGVHNGYGGIFTFREFGPRKRAMLFKLNTSFVLDWNLELRDASTAFDRQSVGLLHDYTTNSFTAIVDGDRSIEIYKVSTWGTCQSINKISLIDPSSPASVEIIPTAATKLFNFPNSNAGFALTGMTGTNANQPFIGILDHNGILLNTFQIYDLDNDAFTSEKPLTIKQDGSDILIAGTIDKGNFAHGFILKMKPYSGSGIFAPTVIFSKEYNVPDSGNPGNEDDVITGMVVNSNSEYILSGYTDQNNGTKEGFIMKTISDGTAQWLNNYTETLFDYSRAFDIELDPNGGYFLVGEQIKSGFFNENKIWAAKTDDQGFFFDCECFDFNTVIPFDLMPTSYSLLENETILSCTPDYADTRFTVENDIKSYCDQYIAIPDSCVADFQWMSLDDCGKIQFTDLSVGSGLTFNWDFGDTNGSSIQNPDHTYASPGTYLVCLTIVEIGTGCTNSVCQNINVTIDQTPPIAQCLSNLSIQIDPITCEASLTPNDIDAGSFDNLAICNRTLDQSVLMGSCGTNITVTLTVTDCCSNSSSCWTTVSLVDNNSPSILNCPSDISLTGNINNSGACTNMYPFPPLAATDCQINLSYNYTLSGATLGSGNTNDISTIEFNEGLTTVSWVVDDGCGNISQCQHNIEILPCPCPCPLEPVIACPPDLTIECNDSIHPDDTGWPTIVFEDCEDLETLTYSDEWDITNPCHRILTREWIGIDSCEHADTCKQLIHLIDTENPVIISCPQDITVQGSYDSNGLCTANVDIDPVLAEDGCNKGSLTYSYSISGATVGSGYDDASDIFNAGISTIDWTITELCGNSSTCQTTVTVDTCCTTEFICPNDTILNCCDTLNLTDLFEIDSCYFDTVICVRDDALGLDDPFYPGTTCVECIITHNQGELKLVANDAVNFDAFGGSVSISGNYAVAGAHLHGNIGSAYVFYNNGTTWVQQAKLIPNDGANQDLFGWSVDIHGDYIVVGARWDNHSGKADAGSAYIFHRTGTTWVQQAKLIPNDAQASAEFGTSVAIHNDYVIIGAPEDDHSGVIDAGSAYIFQRVGTSWTQQAKIFAFQLNDHFGNSVDIYGQDVIIGAPYHPHNNLLGAGAAYVFSRSGSNWVINKLLLAPNAQSGDQFGRSVSIWDDRLVVSTRYGDHQGLVNVGTVFTYQRIGNTWNFDTKLGPNDPNSLEYGSSVSIYEDKLVVGQNYLNNVGSSYVYGIVGNKWSELLHLQASDAIQFDEFGNSVAVSGSDLIIGAKGAWPNRTGAAYVYDCSLLYDTCKVTITVLDDPPIFSYCPPDSIIDCGITLDPVKTGFPIASDDCNTNIDIDYTDQVDSSDPCMVEVIREWIAIDSCGQSDTCTQVFIQIDTLAPVIMCPLDVTVNCDIDYNDPNNTGGSATASDNCNTFNIIYSQRLVNGNNCFSMFRRSWIAEDACGNFSNCDQFITVVDTIPPEINCPDDITLLCDSGTSILITGEPVTKIFCTPIQTSYTDINTNGTSCHTIIERQWISVDECMNADTCIQFIELLDNTGPDITSCPTDITVNIPMPASGPCVHNYELSIPSAVDDCHNFNWAYELTKATQAQGTPNFGFPPKVNLNDGTTMVTWTATDQCSNSTTCSFSITLNCVDSCMLLCPGDITQNTDTGICSAFVSVAIPQFTGDCSNFSTPINNYNGTGNASDNYPLGTTIVVWTSSDGIKTLSCSMKVEVIDNEAPFFTNCLPLITEYVCNPLTTTNINWNLGEGDNCEFSAPVTLICTPPQGTFSVGTTPVVCTVTDGVGLSTDCLFDVELIQIKPAADFIWNEIACAQIQFNDGSSTNDPGGITSYLWDFGDGNTSTLKNPDHFYTSGGPYTVCLTITTAEGCSNKWCDLITVNYPNSCNNLQVDVDAGFYFSHIAGSPCTRILEPKSLGPCDEVNWSIAPTSGSISINPITSYGNDLVTLTDVTGGCFWITMTVKRILQNGTSCEKSKSEFHCLKKCNATFPSQNLCHIVNNGDFSNQLQGWKVVAGNPEWKSGTEEDCSDPGIIELSGNSEVADIIEQDLTGKLPSNDVYDFLVWICASPTDLKPPSPGTRLVVRTSSSPIVDLSCEEDCDIIGVIYYEDNDDWPPQDPLFTKYMFNSLAIHVENLEDDDTTPESRDIICLSNVCIEAIEEQDTITAVNVLESSLAVSIFPSPTTGKFKIKFDNPVHSSLEFHLINLQGEIVYHSFLEKDKLIHDFDLDNLSAGIFFIQLGNKEGKFVYKKIIKI